MAKIPNLDWSTMWNKIDKVEPSLSFEDIKVGDVIHVPPMGIYDRETHVVISKFPNYIITDKTEGGVTKRGSLFSTELRMRFAVILQELPWNKNDK